MTRRRLRYALLTLAIGCAALALGCGLAAAAVRQGLVPPPNLNIQLGGLRVVSVISKSPDCLRLRIPDCSALNQIPTTRVYTLWLFVRRDPTSWERPASRPLFSLPVGR